MPNNEIAAGLDYLTKDRIRAKLDGRADDYAREFTAKSDGRSDVVTITRAGHVYGGQLTVDNTRKTVHWTDFSHQRTALGDYPKKLGTTAKYSNGRARWRPEPRC